MLATIQRHTMLGITGLVATGFAVRGGLDLWQLRAHPPKPGEGAAILKAREALNGQVKKLSLTLLKARNAFTPAVRGLPEGPVYKAWQKLGTSLTLETARATVNGLSPTRKVGEAGGYLAVAAMFATMSVLLKVYWIPPVA